MLFFLWTGAPIQLVKKMTWNRAQKSWTGEAVKLKKNVACRVLEGGGLKHALESWNGDKKSWRGEAVKLRHTLACRVLGREGLINDLES